MVRGHGQKELIQKQMEMEGKPKAKLPVKVGSIVEFVDTPEHNGVVRTITKDQWQTVFISYTENEPSIFFQGHEIIDMFSDGKIVVKNLPVRKGSLVEFVDPPELTGTINSIGNDRMRTVFIDFGEGKLKPIYSYDLIKMVEAGKILIKKK